MILNYKSQLAKHLFNNNLTSKDDQGNKILRQTLSICRIKQIRPFTKKNPIKSTPR